MATKIASSSTAFPFLATNSSLQAEDSDIDRMSLIGSRYMNLSWMAATGLAVWFLFFHTQGFWRQRSLPMSDPTLTVHIFMAGTIYLSCAHNCLCTPGGGFLQRHTWIGRVGLVSGVLSFLLGCWMAWSRLGKSTNLGFALPITIGGLLQLTAQYNGYVAIRKYKELDDGPERQALLRSHIGNMVSLFVLACGIPAAIRLSEQCIPNATASIVGLILLIFGFQKMAERQMKVLTEP